MYSAVMMDIQALVGTIEKARRNGRKGWRALTRHYDERGHQQLLESCKSAYRQWDLEYRQALQACQSPSMRHNWRHLTLLALRQVRQAEKNWTTRDGDPWVDSGLTVQDCIKAVESIPE